MISSSSGGLATKLICDFYFCNDRHTTELMHDFLPVWSMTLKNARLPKKNGPNSEELHIWFGSSILSFAGVVVTVRSRRTKVRRLVKVETISKMY